MKRLISSFRFGSAITEEGWIYLSGHFSNERLETKCNILDQRHGADQSISECYKDGHNKISDVHDKNDHCQANTKDEWEQPKGLECF